MQNDKKSPVSDLKERTKQFALRVIAVYVALRPQGVAQVLGKQLVRSGTSVGAQYREACRARSVAEFISKMSSALQELEETSYWLELLSDASIVPTARLAPLRGEADELTRILVASINTAQKRRNRL